MSNEVFDYIVHNWDNSDIGSLFLEKIENGFRIKIQGGVKPDGDWFSPADSFFIVEGTALALAKTILFHLPPFRDSEHIKELLEKIDE